MHFFRKEAFAYKVNVREFFQKIHELNSTLNFHAKKLRFYCSRNISMVFLARKIQTILN